MREPAPDYSRGQYERPNQPWLCGLASDGQACPAGPTARGQCPALAECAPLRDGDRWRCNRSELRGGECEHGPTPEGACARVHSCRPVRSLRAIRGRFVTACTLLAAGGLIILLSADWRDEAISPGPLASQHAQILESSANASLEGPGSCAACHGAAERSVAGWTATMVGLHAGQPAQSQRCMDCHDKTISAKLSLAAHNLPANELRKLTEASTSNSKNEIACATCHREHQGSQFDLTAIDNAACQSCHERRYESFASDHPDFGAWPYERRTRIAFNHASHQTKHFVDKKHAFDCNKCHLDDSTGDVQLLASYESACASCHDEKLSTSVAKGVAMLALPTLDVDALKEAGHDIGAWPEAATGDFDGRLPPAMKLLLAGDPKAAEAMKTLGPDFDFFDIDPDDAKQLEACAVLAGAIKELLKAMSANGSETARNRLRAAIGRGISDAELNALLAGLSTEDVSGAVQNWIKEVASATSETVAASPATAASNEEPKQIDFDPAGTWFRDDATLSIRYRPASHADPVLAGWLELLAATPHLAQQPIAQAMLKELSNATAPGLCASCHSVEEVAGGQITINWHAYDRTTAKRTLTKFSHGPHLTLPQLADCTHCHAVDESRGAADSYADWNPHQFASEFAPISKHQCASCHTAKAAGDSCQQCHNYHAEEIESWRVR